MSSDTPPWIRHPSLTLGRLVAVAGVIREVRRDALASHEPLKGDTTWGLGCKSYERTCYALRELALKNPEWMAILPESRALRFSFAIADVSFRFYSGSPDDDPPGRYCSRTFGEIVHQQMCLELDGFRPLNNVLRLAVEPNPVTREVLTVSVVEVDDSGALVNAFVIPELERSVAKIALMRSQPVVLEPPTVEPLSSIEEVSKVDIAHRRQDTGTIDNK